MNQSNYNRVITGALCVFAVAAGSAMGGIRASHAVSMLDDHPERVRVSFSDLDLSKSEGLNALKRRIHTAAEKVCDHGEPHDLRLEMQIRQCVDKASSRAYEQIGLSSGN